MSAYGHPHPPRELTAAELARNALGAAVTRGDPPEALMGYRRNLAEALMASRIRDAIGTGLLTSDARQRLAAIMAGGDGGE
jgi:hypothetical protein